MPLSSFHPAIRRWFTDRFGAPSAPQVEGWPAIRRGSHTLIAAPTGTGKTLAAFLWAIDGLLRQGEALPRATEVLYVSPLKALGNDVQRNLRAPLDALRALDPDLPPLEVLVRSGDTSASDRAAMRRRPPHILVTTPESLFILLASAGGRGMLRTVRTVIVDEIHALAGDKRGAHLALSLERLESLTGDAPQRIGLSATQRPIEEVGRLLVGAGRPCTVVDTGHRRDIDLAVEIPQAPLGAVCSHETWEEIYARMAALIRAHRTTIVFVNTRKLAERVAARLTDVLGADQVSSHHGSLARDRRLDAERRLKEGALRALVATASLELGIDVGEVDLVVQVGITPSIAVLLQRVGRAGHALARTPKGRLFPLTRDELVCSGALLDAVQRGLLDRTPSPPAALDILAQQCVAACVGDPEGWIEDDLLALCRRAWPYRDLTQADFDAVVALHTQGRYALLHRDGVNRRLRATRRARLPALTAGGAIPDTADYRVLLEPEGTLVGTIHEDFAVESSVGDIFQLGNASWQVLRVEPGILRVADARGAPPTIPFWLGEGPSRTRELSEGVSRVRSLFADPPAHASIDGLPVGAADQIAGYVHEGTRVLGAVPTRERVVIERFFDESGGTQMVIHAPFGGRINRAWGLALRKRFCRHFGFELQAAANEEAIVISLGPQHSFPLHEVFDYLQPESVRDLLVQAVLPTPLFTTRWRWNVTRSLMVPRTGRGGRRVPAPLIRMRADDALVQSFPAVMACGETLPPGDLPIPWDHPIVRQTLEDCLHEAMDLEGLREVLAGIRDGRIDRVAIDTSEPSAFAAGILNAMPYAFLDDAPLEERRTQAVIARRGLDRVGADTLGALDPRAVAAVRDQAWPRPLDAEEVHEALLWMGYVRDDEARASGWMDHLASLEAAGRADHEGDRWYAVEASRDPVATLRGRLEALGPVFVTGGAPRLEEDAPGAILRLEQEGVAMRCRIDGRDAWCDRRLLARIQRETLDALRREIEPVSAAAFWRFLARWQHAAEGCRLEGPRGVMEIIRQLAGFEGPAGAWESGILTTRVHHYRGEWIDALALSGDCVWLRLWGEGSAPVRSTPICLIPRADLDEWLALAPPRTGETPLTSHARTVLARLEERGASFVADLTRTSRLLEDHVEMGLAELVGRGMVTCDSFEGLRWLLGPAARRRAPRRPPAGRWSLLDRGGDDDPTARGDTDRADGAAAFAARQLLRRYGVVFKRLLDRERIPVAWRDLHRAYRLMELRGECRGGRFVARFSGEQFALAEAVAELRSGRDAPADPLSLSAADPLNLQGILTPDERIPAHTRRRVRVG